MILYFLFLNGIIFFSLPPTDEILVLSDRTILKKRCYFIIIIIITINCFLHVSYKAMLPNLVSGYVVNSNMPTTEKNTLLNSTDHVVC